MKGEKEILFIISLIKPAYYFMADGGCGAGTLLLIGGNECR